MVSLQNDGPSAPEKVLQQIQKLLNLANKNTNPHEAAQAAAKAQALLEEWNLDVAALENVADPSGRREDEKVKGGFYKWQRELWRSVSDLHFCLYFITEIWDPNKSTPNTRYYQTKGAYVKRHRLVGRTVNVCATMHLAMYLEQAIEAQVNERTRGARSQAFSNWAVSFRTGAAASLIERLEERRQERVEQATERAATAAAAAGASTSTALTLEDVAKREEDANNDFLYGEGWSAKQAAQRAAYAEENRQRREAYTQWAAENPEEAQAQEAERRMEHAKWLHRHRSRGGGTARDNLDYGAYRTGVQAGRNISIDPQIDTARPAGLLR